MKTIAFARAAGCVVLVHSEAQPSDDEWHRYLKVLEQWFSEMTPQRLLVVSEGGTPTPRQRKLMAAGVQGRFPDTETAVLTGSTFVRGVMHAFSFFNPHYRAFDLGAIDAALDHLRVPRSAFDAVKRCVDACRAELDAAPNP
jgi:hypothetical protein